MASLNFKQIKGRSLDALPLKVRWTLTGMWVATEMYSPARLPLRVVAAIGSDARDCVSQLQAQGLDPTLYEYEPLPEPYQTPD